MTEIREVLDEIDLTIEALGDVAELILGSKECSKGGGCLVMIKEKLARDVALVWEQIKNIDLKTDI